MKTYIVFFVFSLVEIIVATDCCAKKEISGGGNEKDGTYVLKTLLGDTSNLPIECKDGCVYTKDGEGEYCFKVGTMESECYTTGYFFLPRGKVTPLSYPCTENPYYLPFSLSWTPGGMVEYKEKIFIYDGFLNKCFYGTQGETTWTETVNCMDTSGIKASSIVAVGQYIISTGGDIANQRTDKIYIYDGTKWTELANKLTSQRRNHCSVATSETTIVVMGGQGNGSPSRLKTVEEIDIDGNSNPLPNLKIERTAMGCALYKDEIFAVGGIGGSNGNDVEIYNIQRKEWRTVGKLAGLKRYGPMHVFNGKLTIFGGGSSTIEAFKEDDETWETVDTVAGFNSDYGYGSASVPIYCKV